MSFEAFNFPFVCSFLWECKCKFDSVHSARLNSSEISSTNIRKHHKVPQTIPSQAIRTNNDVEGWHNGLTRRASGRSNIPFYLLIQLLKREAELCAVQVKLVSERKLQRIQRKKYRKLQAQVFELWGQYANNQKTATQLLKACSYLNGPMRVDYM